MTHSQIFTKEQAAKSRVFASGGIAWVIGAITKNHFTGYDRKTGESRIFTFSKMTNSDFFLVV